MSTHHVTPPRAKQAFSLVELAIVLVILGLLAGGVLSGTSLIRAAELRSVATEYDRYYTATQSFRDKYMALPGDMTNATKFWGAAANCPGDESQGSTDQATCDGNGDGVYSNFSGSNEEFRLWQQLANAGLIEGQYSGVQATSGSEHSCSKANSPSGKLPTSLWHFGYQGTMTTANANASKVFVGDYVNFLEVGGILDGTQPVTPIFKPEELWNIDTKMDDGKPATGKLRIRAWSNGISACTDKTDPNAFDAAYKLQAPGKECSAIFQQVM